jgi:hypothetical protein
MMDLIGLVVECLFFAAAIYLFAFARGRIRHRDPDRQQKLEAFRKSNAGWLTILSIGLGAIMLLNIIVHILQLSGDITF